MDYHGVELDVAISRDQVPVLSHGFEVGGEIHWPDRYTFEELQRFSLGTWQDHTVRMPSLEEALRMNGIRGLFMADMRVDAALAWAISNAVSQAVFDERRLVITAYDLATAVVYKQTFPCARVFLKDYVHPAEIPTTLLDVVAASGLDGIMLQCPDDGQSIQAFVNAVHCRGLRLTLFVHYAADPLEDLQAMVNAGTDYILTVHDEMRAQLTWPPADPEVPVLSCTDSATGDLMLSWRYQWPYAHRLQWSSDFMRWADAALPVDCTATSLQVQCIIPASDAGSRRFYRLAFSPD